MQIGLSPKICANGLERHADSFANSLRKWICHKFVTFESVSHVKMFGYLFISSKRIFASAHPFHNKICCFVSKGYDFVTNFGLTPKSLIAKVLFLVVLDFLPSGVIHV